MNSTYKVHELLIMQQILIKINITLFIQLRHFHPKNNKINIENIGYNA
jgi:hypothetical protein